MTASIIERAQTERRALLNEVESKEVLAAAGIDVARARLAVTREEAVAAARELGFPAVMKVVSQDVPHKSDVGGVVLGIGGADAAGAAYDAIVASVRKAAPEARIEGVSVQRQAAQGIEVIAGMTRDPQFGPLIMFGLGGVLVEVLEDVSFRLVPLTERDAGQMLDEIRGAPVLRGYRGQPPADREALQRLLTKLSSFIDEHPEIEQLDLNPVFAYPDGVLAVDARIVLSVV